MIIHWHLLAEQLQQHPEQVEEELQAEVLALAGQTEQGRQQMPQSERSQEQDVLQRLQSQLGNFALQQLLSAGRPASAEHDPLPAEQEAPVPEGKTDAEKHHVTAVAAEIPAKTQEDRPAVDPTRRAALLLRQILIGLPDLPIAMLTELAMLVEQQAPELKVGIVDSLERRINSLTPAAREALMSLIGRLPRSLTSSALMAALLSRLLVIRPPAPPPPPAAPPPEA